MEEIQQLDVNEQESQLSEEERNRSLQLKDIYGRKLREEEIKWRQRSHCQWLKKGDKNTKIFYRVASARMRGNRISFLMDGDA